MEYYYCHRDTCFGFDHQHTPISVPVSAIDILRLAGESLRQPVAVSEVVLVPFFIAELAADPSCREFARSLEVNGVIRGKCQYQIHLLTTAAVANDIAVIRAKTGISRTSDIVRLAIESLYCDLVLHQSSRAFSALN